MVNILDVAERAGVSKSTVSRVINQPDTVKEALRLRVQQAIKELDPVTKQIRDMQKEAERIRKMITL